MPELKSYNLFVSHAWRYNDEYYKLIDLLDDAPNFAYKNYSVPEHDPVIDPDSQAGKQKLTELLSAQIRFTHCVLILSGMYSTYSDWIKREIRISREFKKPIIGVIPWGQERVPTDIQEGCDTMVGWNTSSIVSAIRTYSL